MNKAAGQGTPVVNGSQVFAAGLASTGAAIVTSMFGVAGTILGAALTTMIITGGAMILKAYLESVTGKLRAQRERRKAKRYAKPETLPDRPDLRDNFMGSMRAAVGWFSYLPLPARRSILVKGLIAAAVAFVISMGAIYVVERGIGNSLSCGLWGTCPEGATPGIHLRGGGGGTGAGSTIGGGRVSQIGGIDRDGRVIGPDQQSSPLRQQDPGYQPPAQRQQDPSYQPPAQRQTPPDPNVEPVDPNGEPAPVEPVEPEVPSEPGQPVPGQPTPQQQVPSEEGDEVPSQQGVPPGAEPKPTPLQ